MVPVQATALDTAQSAALGQQAAGRGHGDPGRARSAVDPRRRQGAGRPCRPADQPVGPGASSSISVTASARHPDRPCRAGGEPGDARMTAPARSGTRRRRPLPPRRARQPEGGAALPVQPVHDPAIIEAPAATCAGARRPDLVHAGGGGLRELRVDGRLLAAAAGEPAPQARELAASVGRGQCRRAGVHRHALLAAELPPPRPRRWRPSPPTRW